MNSHLSNGRRIPLLLLGFLILSGAIGISAYFLTNKKAPRRKPPVSYVPAVEIMKIKPSGTFIEIPAMGKIEADEKVSLKSQVSGKINWTSPKLKDGGIFRKGETILKIDPRDYELALTQSKAVLENAKYELKLEQGQQDLAKRQWDLLGKDLKSTELEKELALRAPHLKQKLAALYSAEASVKQARINLERTVIKAPFNCIVQNVQVSGGDIATTGTSLSELINIDRYNLIASIPVDSVKWIAFPGKKSSGSKVTIKSSSGKTFIGRVKRLHSGLEDSGKMARLTISINDPLGYRAGGYRQKNSLLIGEYISSTIKGAYLQGVSRIPSMAVHDGDTIWITGEKDRLDLQKINIIWRDNEYVYTTSLKDKIELILSDIATPVKNLKLNVLRKTEKTEKGKKL